MAVDWRIRYVILALLWGPSFLFITIGVEALAPLQVAFARLALGTATLLTVMVLRREKLPTTAAMWRHMAVAGLMYNAVPFTLFSIAATHIPSGLSGIVNATTPLFTMLLALTFLPSERPTATRLAGIAIGFAGVVVVMGGPRVWSDVADGSVGPLVFGMALGLAAAACYGVASVYTRRYLTDTGHSTVSLAAGQVLIATVVIGIATPVFTTMPSEIPLRVVGAMLALGVLGTGTTYLLFYGLVREVGATVASTVTYLLPVVAVAAGTVVLGERLAWYQILGGGIVVLGAVVALRPVPAHRRTPAAEPVATPADGLPAHGLTTIPDSAVPPAHRVPVPRQGAAGDPAASPAGNRPGQSTPTATGSR